MSGILAIWNDCAPGREAAYEEWIGVYRLMCCLGNEDLV